MKKYDFQSEIQITFNLNLMAIYGTLSLNNGKPFDLYGITYIPITNSLAVSWNLQKYEKYIQFNNKDYIQNQLSL